MVEGSQYKHWKINVDGDDIAWLHLDKADSNANVLSSEVLEELSAILDDLTSKALKGLIILSDKPAGFIAGADVREFTTIKDEQTAFELIQKGQSVFNTIENLSYPTLCLIHGFCLGGGMELALACRYRIAEDGPKTKLGLPEVLLGIHPGFGGTYRVTRLLDAPAALDLMLQGRAIRASAAKRLGLVDAIVPSRQLMKAARAIILNPALIKKPFKLWRFISNHRVVRPVLVNLIKKKVAQRVKKSHYPAPYAIIDLWKDHALNKLVMLRAEAESVAKLITSPTAQNLIRVFFLQERLKSLGKKSDFPAKHVHVIGAGTMGADIAAWCAAQGMKVTLQDREAKFIASGFKRASLFFEKRFKKPGLVREVMDRFVADISGDGLKNADVIVEAVFESLEVKQELFRKIEPLIKEGAILATNTSSIPLENIATVLQKPERLIGLHFFNPVAKMPLVEVVCSEQNPKKIIDQALSFVRLIDKLPLPVKSVPGFLVNRVLMPYLIEATVLVSEGIAPELVDKTALDFGMPMGPIELADTVGLDVCLSVAEIFSKHYGLKVPELLQKMVKDGCLGKKSNHGFYIYKKGKKQKKPVQGGQASKDLTERLIKPFLLEARKCLNEKVVQDDELIDAGIIFGTGFAPFRGGPMHYLKDQPLEV